MRTFIFTFPANHPLRNHYQIVYARNKFEARLRMFERFGKVWGSQYAEEQAIKYGVLTNKKELNPMYCGR